MSWILTDELEIHVTTDRLRLRSAGRPGGDRNTSAGDPRSQIVAPRTQTLDRVRDLARPAREKFPDHR